MVAELQQFNVSGALIEKGSTGSVTAAITVLMGVANGSVLVPLSCSGNGVLLTTGTP